MKLMDFGSHLKLRFEVQIFSRHRLSRCFLSVAHIPVISETRHYIGLELQRLFEIEEWILGAG